MIQFARIGMMAEGLFCGPAVIQKIEFGTSSTHCLVQGQIAMHSGQAITKLDLVKSGLPSIYMYISNYVLATRGRDERHTLCLS